MFTFKTPLFGPAEFAHFDCEFTAHNDRYRFLLRSSEMSKRLYFTLETDTDNVITRTADIEEDVDEYEVHFDLTKHLIKCFYSSTNAYVAIQIS